MKKYIKKSVSVLLVIIMLFGNAALMGSTAFNSMIDFTSIKAKAYKNSDGFYYDVRTDEEGEYAVISGADSSVVTGDVIIPSTIDGYIVKTIGKNAFYNRSGITSVDIPRSVVKIDESAFYYCQKLIKVSINSDSQLTEIGMTAFAECPELVSFKLPDSVKTINSGAFKNCKSLVTISIGDNSQLSAIGGSAFNGCSSLVKFFISENVDTIGDYAFDNCISLASFEVDTDNKNYSSDENGILFSKDKIELLRYPQAKASTSFIIPSHVVSLADGAFAYADKLEAVEISEYITTISNSAFYSCVNLKHVIIPDNSNLSVIDSNAFYNCKSLVSIVIPVGVTSINDSAFKYCENIYNVEFKSNSNLKTIGNSAFIGCYDMTKISLPSSLTELGSNAFCNCSNLKEVNFNGNSNLKEIKFSTFSSSGIFKIDIPQSVEIIGENAFKDCIKLRIVNFESGSKLKTINSNAFYCCKSLLNIVLPYGLDVIPRSVFNKTSLMYVHVPSTVTSIATGNFENAVSICSDSENSFAKEYAELKGIDFKVCDGTHSYPTPSVKLNSNKTGNIYRVGEYFNITAELENAPADASVKCLLKNKITGFDTGFLYSPEFFSNFNSPSYNVLEITARIYVSGEYGGTYLVDDNGEYIEDTIVITVNSNIFDLIAMYFRAIVEFFRDLFNIS